MPVPTYIVVLTGFVGTVVVALRALRQGRISPTHRVPWIIAMAALGVDSVVHLAVSVGALVTGGRESMWIVIGSAAIGGVFATAWISPRITGWWLITTAIGLPVLLLAATAVFPSGAEETLPVGVLLTFYTPRMLIVGGLLIWSTLTRRMPQSVPRAGRVGY